MIGLFGDVSLVDQLCYRDSNFGLFQYPDNLFHGKLLLFVSNVVTDKWLAI